MHDIPTAYQLRGALLVARLIPPDGARRADLRLAYQALPSAGAFHLLDLQRAESLLVEWGLLDTQDERLCLSARLMELVTDSDSGACETLAAEVLGAAAPPWLAVAVGPDNVATELLPDVVLEGLASAFPDPDRREAVLLAAGRIADQNYRHEIGEAGEELVVATARSELERLGRPDLARNVIRVSLRSDQLGYDVRLPTLSGGVWRVEVKSSSRHLLALEYVISRGEAEAGRRLRDWALTVCHVPPIGVGTVVGWCGFDEIAPALPQDAEPNGRWESARVRAHPEMLKPGLPPLDS